MDKKILRHMLYKKLTKEQQNHYRDAMEITLNEDEIMTNQHVQKLLNVSQRTLYIWRKRRLISFFKIRSRNYYLKTILLLDFLNITNNKSVIKTGFFYTPKTQNGYSLDIPRTNLGYRTDIEKIYKVEKKPNFYMQFGNSWQLIAYLSNILKAIKKIPNLAICKTKRYEKHQTVTNKLNNSIMGKIDD